MADVYERERLKVKERKERVECGNRLAGKHRHAVTLFNEIIEPDSEAIVQVSPQLVCSEDGQGGPTNREHWRFVTDSTTTIF